MNPKHIDESEILYDDSSSNSGMTPLQDSFKQETKPKNHLENKPQAIRSLLDSRPSPGDKLTSNIRFSGNFLEKNNTCNLSEHKSILE